MTSNRILFHDASLQRFDWCRFNETTESWESGHAEIEQLGRVFEAGSQLTLFLPQQILLQTLAQMPPRATKQQLNAISYAIEDQIAEDIESCFFATHHQSEDGSVPVVVISLQIMDQVIDLLNEHHLTARYILPQLYLCPVADDSTVIAHICSWHGGFLLRSGMHQGLYCEADILPQVLQLVSRQAQQISQQVIFHGELPDNLDNSGIEIVQQAGLELLTQDVHLADCVNLKQKQYQTSNQWLSVLRLWKWPVMAFALLLLILIGNMGMNLWQSKRAVDDLLRQQSALLQQYLPALANSENPRRDLTKYLADHRANTQQEGFLDQLHEYVRLKSGLDQIKTGKIQYQKSSLVVDLESKDLKSLEALRSKLGQSSFSARIENVNISPEKTTGRLVMEVQQ